MMTRHGWIGSLCLSLATLGAPAFTQADVHEARVPLRDGKLSVAELSAALSDECGLPEIEFAWGGSVDLSGFGKTVLVHALNHALGGGCELAVEPTALVIRVDWDKLPKSVKHAKLAARTFTADVAPDATARQQQRFGLLLPAHLQSDQPIVVLIHGVDCTRDSMAPLADLLKADGKQVGLFGYPDDQAIDDSAKLLTQHLAAYHEQFPNSPIDVVAFSMGGLVARSSIEGDAYPGGVRKLILLAPPNHGSSWAPARFILEAKEQWTFWRKEPDWSPSWMITDGLGEAGRDLQPGSTFLNRLNSHGRRTGVAYTIVNGNESAICNAAANVAESLASEVGPTISHDLALDRAATLARNHVANNDGPVSLKSTQLDGVTDVVTVRADHNGLYLPADGKPPAAWDTIRERLGQ